MKNWKTTFSGAGATIFALLAALATLGPATLGPAYDLLPAEWKPLLAKIGGISALVLFFVKSVNTADAHPTPLPADAARKVVTLLVAGGFLGAGAWLLTGCYPYYEADATTWHVGVTGTHHEVAVAVGRLIGDPNLGAGLAK